MFVNCFTESNVFSIMTLFYALNTVSTASTGIGKDVRHAHMAYEAKIWRIIKPLTAPRLRLCRK